MTTELPHRPHQCPCCELRFAWRTELEDHVAAEHGTVAETGTNAERPRRTGR